MKDARSKLEGLGQAQLDISPKVGSWGTEWISEHILLHLGSVFGQ